MPDRRAVPFADEPLPDETRLCRAATPVLERLARRLEGDRAAILLSDAGARILRRWTGERDARGAMDRVFAAPGFVFLEELVGTNGIGTPLEAGRPVAVVGCEHYIEALDPAACVGAPIRHPMGGRIEGVVNLTTRARDASPLQLALVEEVAHEIENELHAAATGRERLLLDAFVRARRGSRQPVVCVGEEMVLTTPAAARLVDPVDQGLLWDRAAAAVADGESAIEVPTAAGSTVRARCSPVANGGDPLGVLLALEVPTPGIDRSVPAVTAPDAGAWNTALASAAELRVPTLVCGEPGVGKATAVRAAAAAAGLGSPTELDAGGEALAGASEWLGRLDRHLRDSRAVLVCHADELSPAAASGMAQLIDAAPAGGPWLAATACRIEPAGGTWRRLRDRLAGREVEVPPLRLRPEAIPGLARTLLRRHTGTGFDQGLRPDVVQLFQRLAWPGNVRELERVLQAASARRRAGEIRVADLPAHVLTTASWRQLTVLERAELESIVEALELTDGNKREAARRLGIARSTLYRKLRAYGLDLDRSSGVARV